MACHEACRRIDLLLAVEGVEQRRSDLLGCNGQVIQPIAGACAEELIHLFALAMKHGITAGDVKDLVYGFPTFSADIKSLW
jgi:pyruvate/2-oxoglutarate dehydrogenase complex dihydrolipoamide dehydrogenase (E3) component